MPQFLDPFVGCVPGRRMTERELTRALRLALSAEEEAVHLYESLADATDHPLAKAVLEDIAREERVHAGEFQRVLARLILDEDARMAEGAAEVDALVAEGPKAAASAAAAGSTVGSLAGVDQGGGR
jgi:uncharacterized protein